MVQNLVKISMVVDSRVVGYRIITRTFDNFLVMILGSHSGYRFLVIYQLPGNNTINFLRNNIARRRMGKAVKRFSNIFSPTNTPSRRNAGACINISRRNIPIVYIK